MKILFQLLFILLIYLIININECYSFICSHGYEFNTEKKKQIENISLYYNKQHLIGEGGIGKVYHAFWINENKCVAFKISPDDCGNKQALKNEINIFQRLAQLNENISYIIKLYGFDAHSIVMELGGDSLYKYYFDNIRIRNMDRRHIVKILRGAARAVNEFHNYELIHLDIKTNNFVKPLEDVQNQDNEIKFKLIDFNISVLSNEITKAKINKMIKEYVPPELRRGDTRKVSKKVDVWLFGLMGYKLLYDDIPYVSNCGNIFNSSLCLNNYYKNRNEMLNNYRNNNERNTPLDQIIKDCINEDPNNRPDIIHVLNRLLEL